MESKITITIDIDKENLTLKGNLNNLGIIDYMASITSVITTLLENVSAQLDETKLNEDNKRVLVLATIKSLVDRISEMCQSYGIEITQELQNLIEATEIYQIPTSEVDPSILFQLVKRQIIRESKNE